MSSSDSLEYQVPPALIDYEISIYNPLCIELAKILKEDADSVAHQEIWNLLNYLKECYEPTEAFKEQLSKTQAVGAHKSAKNHLRSVKNDLKLLKALDLIHLDGCHHMANREVPDGSTEAFILDAEKMISALALAIDNPLETAGSVELRYEGAFLDIAKLLRKHYPERSISKNASSLFYNIIRFWLSKMLKTEIKDPSGHIRAFLASKGSIFK